MTTILILAIDSDGRTVAFRPGPHMTNYILNLAMPIEKPSRSGDDRGHYDVFEVAGVSIDVTRIPEAKHGE